MNNQEFIKYTSNRYGLDENTIETMVDMFAESLQELINAGQSVTIDEIGQFKPIPLFPNGLNYNNSIGLAQVAKRTMISFKPCEKLAKGAV